MVFLVGPRQVGKTWLAKRIMQNFSRPQYLNYDSLTDRKIITTQTWAFDCDLLVLDEIHKMPDWKNFLKGVYDTRPANQTYLITGSARLETFRNSGDSLAGRYFSYKLFPFTLYELKQFDQVDLEKQISHGGFPEPFLSSIDDSRRWRKQYIDGLIRTDILDFEKIHDFRAIQLVLKLLRERVSSQISYSKIANDVQVSSTTVKKYIDIFESLFIIFRVTPFSKKIARSILKEPKIYFYDTAMVQANDGAVFENLMALELLAHQQRKIDLKGIDASLNYIRTKEGKEVDFCLNDEGNISSIIEIKLSDNNISSNLKYFCNRYDLKGVQIVKNIKNEYDNDKIIVRGPNYSF